MGADHLIFAAIPFLPLISVIYYYKLIITFLCAFFLPTIADPF
jgi:hypothetical protein